MKTPYGLSHVGIDSEPDGLIDAASVQRNRSLPVTRTRLMSCSAVRAWSACHLCCPDPLSIIASLTTHPVVAEPRPPTTTPSAVQVRFAASESSVTGLGHSDPFSSFPS